MTALSPELTAAALTAAFTGILWIPIVVNRFQELGLWPALQNPEPDARPAAAWAYRLGNAHRNAIENLVVFAPLAIVVHLTQAGDGFTGAAGTLFVWSRIAHAVIYTLGLPVWRTLAFLIGFGCQTVYALRLLGGV